MAAAHAAHEVIVVGEDSDSDDSEPRTHGRGGPPRPAGASTSRAHPLSQAPGSGRSPARKVTQLKKINRKRPAPATAFASSAYSSAAMAAPPAAAAAAAAAVAAPQTARSSANANASAGAGAAAAGSSARASQPTPIVVDHGDDDKDEDEDDDEEDVDIVTVTETPKRRRTSSPAAGTSATPATPVLVMAANVAASALPPSPSPSATAAPSTPSPAPESRSAAAAAATASPNSAASHPGGQTKDLCLRCMRGNTDTMCSRCSLRAHTSCIYRKQSQDNDGFCLLCLFRIKSKQSDMEAPKRFIIPQPAEPPGAPMKPKVITPWNIFSESTWAKVHERRKAGAVEVPVKQALDIIGKQWCEMPEIHRTPFRKKAEEENVKAKRAYDAKMREYKASDVYKQYWARLQSEQETMDSLHTSASRMFARRQRLLGSLALPKPVPVHESQTDQSPAMSAAPDQSPAAPAAPDQSPATPAAPGTPVVSAAAKATGVPGAAPAASAEPSPGAAAAAAAAPQPSAKKRTKATAGAMNMAPLTQEIIDNYKAIVAAAEEKRDRIENVVLLMETKVIGFQLQG